MAVLKIGNQCCSIFLNFVAKLNLKKFFSKNCLFPWPPADRLSDQRSHKDWTSQYFSLSVSFCSKQFENVKFQINRDLFHSHFPIPHTLRNFKLTSVWLQGSSLWSLENLYIFCAFYCFCFWWGHLVSASSSSPVIIFLWDTCPPDSAGYVPVLGHQLFQLLRSPKTNPTYGFKLT